MLGSFIESDVYRVLLGCSEREGLIEAIRRESLSHDGHVRAMRCDDGAAITVATLFVDGLALQKLSLWPELRLLQVDNISARLRAVPPPRKGEPGSNYLSFASRITA